jgi:hypothetical protein
LLGRSLLLLDLHSVNDRLPVNLISPHTFLEQAMEGRTVLSLYRGHWILLLRDRHWCCEVTEHASGEILPTCASATLEEGFTVCLERAWRLIDKYVSQSSTEARVTCFGPGGKSFSGVPLEFYEGYSRKVA